MCDLPKEGKRRNETNYQGSALVRARVVLSTLEGAMLLARASKRW